MEKASRVMYTIANIFTWILVLFSIVAIVFSILSIADVFDIFKDLPEVAGRAYGIGTLVYFIIVLIVGLITIAMVRKAKGKNTSKGWDILFIVLGVLGGNIFYILGGIFGVIAVRK